jgi:peptidoglycan/xylan/chitin deacetylase (PgdA/CDA1 family)
MEWNGHPFAFVLRIDVEHREAERYTGDPRTERVATRMLLDVLEEFDARFTCPILGITAELYPDVVRWCAARHEIAAHSMFHEPPYPEMSYHQQRWDIQRTVDAIEDACGVRVRGLACPHHGLANEDTARAAIDMGLAYLQGRVADIPPGPGFTWYRVPDRERPILVLGRQRYGASDWSGRRREWPWIEEPWSPETALRRWTGLIDRAQAEGELATLVVHPWMLHSNEGEVRVVQQVLRHAAEQGAWLTSYDRIADLAIMAGAAA